MSSMGRPYEAPHAVRSVSWLVAALCVAVPPMLVGAQGRPAGNGRVWAELGIAAGQQTQRCHTCIGTSTIGGAALTVAAGSTLPRGFGIALLGRAFNQLDFESTLRSRYVVALGQFTPPGVSFVTLNGGAGWGRHAGDTTPFTSDGSGGIIFAGAALRLPARAPLALSVTADLMQSISGRPDPHPRLLSIGIAVGVATTELRVPPR